MKPTSFPVAPLGVAGTLGGRLAHVVCRFDMCARSRRPADKAVRELARDFFTDRLVRAPLSRPNADLKDPATVGGSPVKKRDGPMVCRGADWNNIENRKVRVQRIQCRFDDLLKLVLRGGQPIPPRDSF
jgi:hypothetical protein